MGEKGRTYWSRDSLPISYWGRKLSSITTGEFSRSLVLLGFCCFAFSATGSFPRVKSYLRNMIEAFIALPGTDNE